MLASSSDALLGVHGLVGQEGQRSLPVTVHPANASHEPIDSARGYWPLLVEGTVDPSLCVAHTSHEVTSIVDLHDWHVEQVTRAGSSVC